MGSGMILETGTGTCSCYNMIHLRCGDAQVVPGE